MNTFDDYTFFISIILYIETYIKNSLSHNDLQLYNNYQQIDLTFQSGNT